MKAKLFALSLIIVTAIGVVCYDLYSSPMPDDYVVYPTADFTVTTRDGEEISLHGIKEPFVLMNIWASRCASCIHELPDMLELVAEADGKVALLALSVDDTPEAMELFLQKLEKQVSGVTSQAHVYWVWDEGKAISEGRFGVAKVPETFVFNAARQLLDRFVGMVDWKDPKIRKRSLGLKG